MSGLVSFKALPRLAAVFSFGIGMALACQLSWAQSGLPVVYETRIALPDTEAADALLDETDPTRMNVNEVIFRWTTDKTGGLVTVGDGLTSLAMKVDGSIANTGDVFIDMIVGIDAVSGDPEVLDLVTGDPASPTVVARAAADVLWTFDLDTMQLLEFRNLVDASGSEGTVYKVEGGGGLNSYTVIAESSNGRTPKVFWAESWAKALDMGGNLAVISSASEEQEVSDLVSSVLPGKEAWIGGFQVPDLSEDASTAAVGWYWVDGSVIPAPDSLINYQNWAEGEPDNSKYNGLSADFLVINGVGTDGQLGWNDEANLSNVGGFVVEFPDSGSNVTITRYIDGLEDISSFEDQLIQRTGLVSAFTVRNLFVPEGAGTIFDINTMEQEGNVVVPGIVNADVCLAPDPREPFVINGGGRPPKGEGGAVGGTINDKEGGTGVYNKDDLPVSILAGRGTCTGDLPYATEDDEYQTWEELLADIELVIPGYYRGFFGEVTYTPAGGEEVTVKAVWLTVAVIRTEDVQYDGPVSSVIFPDDWVSYENTPAGEIPACQNELEYRSIDVGGTNPPFDEIANVEHPYVIQQTAQCNRSWSLTQRTTHISPMRYTANGPADKVGTAYLLQQLAGIQETLNEVEAASCAAPTLISALQGSLDQAYTELENQNYDGETGVIANLEEFASIANDDDSYGSDPMTGFNQCGYEANYPGIFVARAISAAFTTWDRLVPSNQDPETWVKYPIPEEFKDLVPDLRYDLGQ